MTGHAAEVVAVALDGAHRFSKPVQPAIVLVAGLGVEGDAHFGATVQHRSRVRHSPGAANLRQVHLLGEDVLYDLARQGFDVPPGAMGENITTRGIDLHALARGTRLRLGATALIEITGLRNPCRQIDDNIGRGAMAATLSTADDGSLILRAGVMAVVVEGGTVRVGDPVVIASVPHRPEPLKPV